MIVLVSGATKTHRRYWDNPAFGHLLTPRAGNSLRVVAENGKPWAADNDAFGGWTREKELAFSRLLGRICRDGRVDTCKFVAAPDIVGNYQATLVLFCQWRSIIQSSGMPVALVAQDGLTPIATPWDRLDAVFIGGSTEFKLSEAADRLILEAKARGKWVHVGRVNTLRRLRHFHDIGVDSIDGTCFSRWPDLYFPKALQWLGRLESQATLFEPPMA
jgi:hypothetical protein